MKQEQSCAMAQIEVISHLTPGDFANVLRQRPRDPAGQVRALVSGRSRLPICPSPCWDNRRFRLREMLPRLARAMMLCKPHPEPTLRIASNFHG
jgi:hypothetical protein